MTPRIHISLRFAAVALAFYAFLALFLFSSKTLLLALAVAVSTFVAASCLESLGRTAGYATAIGVCVAMIGHLGGYLLVGAWISLSAIMNNAPLTISAAADNILTFTVDRILDRFELLLWLPLGALLGREWFWLQKPRRAQTSSSRP